jgi:phage/plasmid-like protein (TIGR03299 family)
MAAELDRLADGTAAVFSVNATPWHREGTILADAPTFADALKLGGLDFQVGLYPVYAKMVVAEGEPGQDTIDLIAPNNNAVVRLDRNEVLSVVGSRYTPMQNADAFKVLEPLVDAGLATLETGGSLSNGRHVWMLSKFKVEDDRVQEVYGKSGILPFACVTNAHDGSRALTVMETPIRIVCKNTLDAALDIADAKGSTSFSIRHTMTIGSKTVEAAKQLFAGIVERHVAIAAQFETLQRTFLTAEQFATVVLDVALPRPAEAQFTEPERFKRAIEKNERRRAAVTTLWTSGAGHVGDHSAWEALNGVVEAIDHDREVFPASHELASLLNGHLGQVKTAVTRSLAQFALVPR